MILLFLFAWKLAAWDVVPKKVLVCGVCRDVERRLPYSIKIIENIGNLFQAYKVLVYENNSHDGTVALLRTWERKNKNVQIFSEYLNEKELKKIIVNITRDGKFFRPELIARARNIVLKKAMSNEYKDFDYIIWIDMDFKIEPCYQGIAEIFMSTKEWDAVFAYGVDPSGQYWDWYALRDNVDPLGPELLGHAWFIPKKLILKPTDDWYPVYSAFGGCGIYKKSSIKNCKYSALVTADLEEVDKNIIEEGKKRKHPKIIDYLNVQSSLKIEKIISEPHVDLPDLKSNNIGIIISDKQDALIWRMNSFTYKYPAICEHVPLHASMIKQGCNKLFINPRMIFTYGR